MSSIGIFFPRTTRTSDWQAHRPDALPENCEIVGRETSDQPASHEIGLFAPTYGAQAPGNAIR